METLEPCQLFELREPALGWTGHLAFVRSERLPCEQVVAAWALDGLAREEKVVYARDGGEGDSSEAFLELLGDHGPAAGSAISEGRLHVVPIEEVYRPGGSEQLVGRALAEGFTAVRVSADLGAAVELLGKSRLARVEQGLEQLCRHGPMSSLCRVAESTCATEPGLLAAHADGICACSLAVVPVAGGARVAGEVDLANEDLFATVLGELAASSELAASGEAASGGGTLRLDLQRLRFLSVGGARALVQATDACRRDGRRVILSGLAPVVRRVLTVCGFEGLFELEDARG